MQTETQITLRKSHPDEDGLIAIHFYRMWRDNDVLDDCLKSLGCTRVILHASPFGKPIYSHLGFSESNEMQLDLG